MTAKDKEKLDTKIVLATGEVYKLLDIFDPETFDKDNRGNIYIKHSELLNAAKKVFKGIKKRVAEVLQTPEKNNNWSATVKVSYLFGNGILWTGTADCRKSTAQEGFKSYTTALAETRASARALRDALGIEFCSTEELSEEEDVNIIITDNKPITDIQITSIENKIVKGKGITLEQIGDVIGRDVRKVKDMSRKEAETVLGFFQSKQKKEK